MAENIINPNNITTRASDLNQVTGYTGGRVSEDNVQNNQNWSQNFLDELGSLFGTGTKALKMEQDFNSREAAIQRYRDLYSDSTKYQRAVQDMIAAGINPAIATGTSGSGINATSTNAKAASSTSTHGGSGITSLIGTVISAALYKTAMENSAELKSNAMKEISKNELEQRTATNARIKALEDQYNSLTK